MVAPVPLPSPSPVPVVYLSSGGGKWLAGAWAGFGDPSPTLGGDAAGVAVNKSGCPYTCLFTHDAALLVRLLPTAVMNMLC